MTSQKHNAMYLLAHHIQACRIHAPDGCLGIMPAKSSRCPAFCSAAPALSSRPCTQGTHCVSLQPMHRSICKGVLEALAYCHSRSVAHGSLGPGSILLNTFRDQQARELIVKLDNFGFAQLHRAGVPSASLQQPCMFSDLCWTQT